MLGTKLADIFHVTLKSTSMPHEKLRVRMVAALWHMSRDDGFLLFPLAEGAPSSSDEEALKSSLQVLAITLEAHKYRAQQDATPNHLKIAGGKVKGDNLRDDVVDKLITDWGHSMEDE